MKRLVTLLGAAGALSLLACVAPARAETLDPAAFERTISFKTAGYDGTSTLEHFPVLVRLSEGIAGFSYADIGTTTNAAYASLRFADADRASLDYEIEEWNPAGTSFVWVSLPELSGTNTEFHAFYAPGAGAVLPAVHPTNVWTSAGYVGVWHMNSRIGNKSTAVYPDATGTAAATHSDASNWQGEFRTASSSTTANGTTWLVQNPPLVVSNDFTQAWTFSQTGCSLEAWRSAQSGNTWTPYFTDGANNAYTFCVGVRGDSTGQGGGVWFHGQSTVRVYPGDSASNTWHFITAVCPAAGSSGNSVLYGEDGSVEDEIAELVTVPASTVAAVDYTLNGMGLTTVIGARSSGTWCDELRVRRGVSTRDWVQANYDVQRVGTDFVEYGAVGDPRAPIVSAVSETAATAVLEFSLAGHGGGTAKALFVAFPSFETNAVAVADLARPSARATGLSPDTDYTVAFVVENGGAVVYETLSTAFTTAGRPTLRPNVYRHSVTFTASGYDGAETLEHFPVLVRLSEAAVPGFSYAGSDPATIRFTAADGALLAHEVETWDPAGLSAIWVALPELSGRDTSFTMHWSPFDGAGVPAQPAYRVWKYAGYVGVWHVNARVQIDGSWCFADSSGGNATLVGQTGNVAEARTEASYNANGTPWTAGNGNNRARTTSTSGWTFSRTGYSVESWISTRDLPGYGTDGRGRNGYMFASDALTENGAEKQWAPANGLQIYPTYATMLGGNTNALTVTQNPAWPGDATNDWHFISAVWPQAGSTDLATLYEAGAGYSSHGTNLRVLRTINRRAIDFTGPRGMGVFGSSDFQGNGCYYDEARVRRGLSSKDWIQANWDTQRVGTDFLAAGTVVDHLLPTVIVVR